MAQHTPGPWHLTPIAGGYRRTGGFKVDPKDGHGAIAKVSYRYTMTNNLGEGQHNAKLIAAAPALLVAASDMMALADTLLTACVGSPVLALLADKGISQTAIARIHAAGAAIAAAQGEG